MAKFVKIPFKQLDKETVGRFQQNVSLKFDDLDALLAPLPVQLVQSSASVSSYLVKNTDNFIVVDSRGGPMKIVLTPPFGKTQTVSVKNAYQNSNTVSIVQSNGKPNGDGLAAVDVPKMTSVQMVNTGKAWFQFGA